MKKIVFALMLLPTLSFAASYYQTQQYRVIPDTTTNKTSWVYRGDVYVGTSSNTANANIVLRGTGTVESTRFIGNGAGLTSLTPASISAGSLPATVIASSVAYNSIYPGACVAGTYSNVTVPAANVAAGNLGASVVASSVAVNTVGPQQLKGTGEASAVTYYRGDGSWATPSGSGGTGTGLAQTITQTSHGFVPGNVLYMSTSTQQYAKAIADNAWTAEVAGIVYSTPTANTFVLTTFGFTDALSNLTTGYTYYLSTATAGAYTSTAPIEYGTVSKPLFIALSSYTAIVANMRGMTVQTGGNLNDSVPVGALIPYSSTSAPANWLYCNGDAVSRTTYAQLFAAIGTKFGAGDGSTTFNLPDMRGMFTRGLDDGRGYDEETGRVIGSTETDKFQAHQHQNTVANGTHAAANGGDFTTMSDVTSGGGQAVSTKYLIADGSSGTPRTGIETRPKNVAVAYIIKYQNAVVNTDVLNSTNVYTAQQNFNGGFTASGKTWQLIWSTTTVATQTSIPTGNVLNGNVDIRYWIIGDYIGASGADNGIQINGDTGGNYARIYNQGQNTTNSVATNNSATQMYIGYVPNAGYFAHSDTYLTAFVANSRPRLYSGTNIMNAPASTTFTAAYIINYGGIWNNTADNITSMTFIGQYAAGSHFEIWALR